MLLGSPDPKLGNPYPVWSELKNESGWWSVIAVALKVGGTRLIKPPKLDTGTQHRNMQGKCACYGVKPMDYGLAEQTGMDKTNRQGHLLPNWHKLPCPFE